MQRKHKRGTTQEERLAADAADLRQQAEQLPPGIERDRLLRKARLNDTAAQMMGWIRSPGLRPPE